MRPGVVPDRKMSQAMVLVRFIPLLLNVTNLYFRPVSGGERVTLSDFPQHRRTHQFRYPCCLCSVHELDPNHVTESVVFMVTSGNLAGEYVAACARGVCKYWGACALKNFILDVLSCWHSFNQENVP
jgi:hypothetical protein